LNGSADAEPLLIEEGTDLLAGLFSFYHFCPVNFTDSILIADPLLYLTPML